MPELPEVETIKNILAQFVIGKTIKDIKVFNTNTIEGDYLAFIEQLKGKTISELSRVGKFIIFHFNESIVLLSHLRMEGKYFYHDYALDTFEKHACVVFFFTDNTVLEYNDTRKFGLMQIVQSSVYLSVLPLSKLGPEPFDVKDIKSLHQKLSKKSIPIKAVLLDQTFLAGLGNIYVDEVLYLTKIHPETPANRISKAQLKNIIEASVQVLNVAIQSGGSTIRSYHPSQGIDGGFQNKLNAYGKENLPCQRCNHPLRKIFVGGRGTTFCPKCQKNPALPYVVGITGPIGSGKSSVLDYFKANGYLTLSGDDIVKNLYLDTTVRDLVIKLFGEHVISDDGTINKKFIIETIINDENKKRRLEKIFHPRVEKVISETISQTKSTRIAFEMPLLFESKLDDYCDETIYIDINIETQQIRLLRRNLPLQTLLALNTGFDSRRNKEKATYVIDNSSTLQKLHEQLKKLVH